MRKDEKSNVNRASQRLFCLPYPYTSSSHLQCTRAYYIIVLIFHACVCAGLLSTSPPLSNRYSCYWKTVAVLKLPPSVMFVDYSSVSLHPSTGKVAISSQENSQVSHERNEKGHFFMMRFCNSFYHMSHSLSELFVPRFHSVVLLLCI